MIQMVGTPVGPHPAPVICPSCQMHIVTRVERKPTTRTHILAAIMCLFLCWPCAFVPYCINSCNNADHYCPNCSAYIGTYAGS